MSKPECQWICRMYRDARRFHTYPLKQLAAMRRDAVLTLWKTRRAG